MVNNRILSYFSSDSKLAVINSQVNISLKCSSYCCIFMPVKLMFVLQIQDVYIYFITKTEESLPKKGKVISGLSITCLFLFCGHLIVAFPTISDDIHNWCKNVKMSFFSQLCVLLIYECKK